MNTTIVNLNCFQLFLMADNFKCFQVFLMADNFKYFSTVSEAAGVLVN